MARRQMDGRTPSSASEIVGRTGELARLAAFLEEGPGTAVFVIEGEPGIGKTTLWRRGLAVATDHGRRVLACSPAESEAALSFAGLSDLLKGLEDIFDALPDPQRYALEVALLRVQPTGPSPGWRAVSAAVLSVIRQLAARGPLLIAVDDLQWLDASTARVLEFAIRRLEDEPVTFLLAQRGGAASPLPLGLERPVAEDRVTRVTLAPLSLDEIRALVHARLGVDLPPSTMRPLYDVSAGNAFFALEIARAEVRGEQRPTGQALPVPQNLRDDLIRDRLGAVPALGREALLYASACARPTVAILEAAMERSPLEPVLVKAAEAGIIELQRGEIGFAHPLYRSAIYSEASREHRHREQRRLAAVATDPAQRARHLALAAEGPDGSAVDALEAGARDAFARGSPAMAAELCELAERLAPPEQDADVRRLRMAAAEYRIFAADVEGALRLLEPVARSAPAGPERAEALLRLGQALLLVDDERAFGVLSEASSEAGAPPSVAIAINGSLARATASLGRLVEAELHANEALSLAERDGDPTQLAAAVTSRAMTR
jgi:hypothetical protein